MAARALSREIDQSLELLRSRYRDRHASSARHLGGASEFLPGGNTRSVLHYDPFPLVIASGEGCRVTDIDGNVFINFLGEYSAGLYGHSHPIILDAIRQACNTGMNLSGPHVGEERLAEVLCQRFPSIKYVRFANSGTEANLFALAAAISYTGKSKIVVFEGGYHGSMLTFMDGARATIPYDFEVLPYNDPASTTELFGRIGPNIAAVLVEPMQSAAGSILGDAEFLRLLRSLCRQNGALLIFDEIVTSRMSSGGLQAILGIVPDLTTLGKYVGGGFPSGAFGGRSDVMSIFDPRRPDAFLHSGTYNNNVFTLAAGHAGLSQVFTPQVARELYQVGEGARNRLNAAARAAKASLQFTGCGSVMTAHFVRGDIRSIRDLADANLGLKEIFFLAMLEKGIYLARRGMITLSVVMGADELERLYCAVGEFLSEYAPLLA